MYVIVEIGGFQASAFPITQPVTLWHKHSMTGKTSGRIPAVIID